MIQAYSPIFNAPARRGYCLEYVDNAGNVPYTAPPRVAKARYAYNNELAAGRISTNIDSPVGIWVVGFLDFTKGPYIAEGHVFFMKHLGGGKYEIRDSEVAAGARQPYGSLAEIVAWFGAYAPKYIGWSTQCSGRKYATKEEDMKPTITKDQVLWHYKLIGGVEPTEQEVNNYAGKDYVAATEEIKRFFANQGRGYQEFRMFMERRIEDLEVKLSAKPLGTEASEAEKKLKALKDALSAL